MLEEEHTQERVLEDHVIIVGFGVNGKTITRACYCYHILYVIVDSNLLFVENEKAL